MKNNEIAAAIANRIIEQLEAGVIPWVRPWVGGQDVATSYVSGKAYSFLNQMLLGAPGEYISFNQAKSNGGTVKKGAKSKKIFFWSINKYDANGKLIKSEDTNAVAEKSIPCMKWWSVFHIDDTEGVKKHVRPLPKGASEDRTAEQIVEEYAARENLEIRREEITGRAFYAINGDYIQIPKIDQFADTAGYYSALFHEVAHSTGAVGRLSRFVNGYESARRGSTSYSKEELVAEITAAALMARVGLETESSFKNSAAYCKGWRDAIKKDNSMILEAASKAEKAFQYILGLNPESFAQ